MIKPLIDFEEALKPYCDKSSTLKVLFDQCVKLGITIHHLVVEDLADIPEVTGDICGPFDKLFNNKPSMDDIAVLAHEMAHATSCGTMNFTSDYWAEKYAYTTGKLILLELDKAGFKVDKVIDKWVRTEEELLKLHPDEPYK